MLKKMIVEKNTIPILMNLARIIRFRPWIAFAPMLKVCTTTDYA